MSQASWACGLPRLWAATYRTGGHRYVVRVVYSDEAGTGDEREEPITIVTAVMINLDSQASPVLAALNKALPANREVKGRRLYKDLRSGRHRNEADGILRGVLSVAANHHLQIFYCAISRAGLRRAANADTGRDRSLDVAYLECFGQVDDYLQGAACEERILWIADRNPPSEQNIKNKRDALEFLRRNPLTQVIRARDSHIVDTVYFGDSRDSRLLQMADICCATIRIRLSKERIADPYYNLIRQQIVNAGQRPLYAKYARSPEGNEFTSPARS
jgi:hypothetical protein